jgi:hypothetical protein
MSQIAKKIGDAATGQGPKPEPPREKNPHAQALGRLGGSKGGKRRAEKLTSEERSDIARRAAIARWENRSE